MCRRLLAEEEAHLTLLQALHIADFEELPLKYDICEVLSKLGSSDPDSSSTVRFSVFLCPISCERRPAAGMASNDEKRCTKIALLCGHAGREAFASLVCPVWGCRAVRKVLAIVSLGGSSGRARQHPSSSCGLQRSQVRHLRLTT